MSVLFLQVRFNLLQYIVSDVKELYSWLEVDFHPLKLCGRVTKVQPCNLSNDLIRVKVAVLSLSDGICGFPGAELGQGSSRKGA